MGRKPTAAAAQTKADAKPNNKAEPKPDNKAEPKPDNKSGAAQGIKLRAVDAFYADDVGQIMPGASFAVASEARAAELVKKGLAVRV